MGQVMPPCGKSDHPQLAGPLFRHWEPHLAASLPDGQSQGRRRGNMRRINSKLNFCLDMKL
jgi:hypothetical protein